MKLLIVIDYCKVNACVQFTASASHCVLIINVNFPECVLLNILQSINIDTYYIYLY